MTGVPILGEEERKILHIVTVGTSLLRNASSRISGEVGEKIKRYANASVNSEDDVEAGNSVRGSSEVFKELLKYVTSDHSNCCAELRPLYYYMKSLEGSKASHDIVLFSSDTGAGRLSSAVLESYLQSISGSDLGDIWGLRGQMIRSAERIVVEGLGRNFTDGGYNLILNTKKVLREKQGRERYDEIVSNLTGGFKPESALLMVASGLIGINKSYYIHEFSHELNMIPILPLKVREDVSNVIRKALEKEELNEVERRILENIGLLSRGQRKLDKNLRKILEALISV